jgi:hypothetical protein
MNPKIAVLAKDEKSKNGLAKRNSLICASSLEVSRIALEITFDFEAIGRLSIWINGVCQSMVNMNAVKRRITLRNRIFRVRSGKNYRPSRQLTVRPRKSKAAHPDKQKTYDILYFEDAALS